MTTHAQHLFASGDVRAAIEALDTRQGTSAADGPPSPADWSGEEYLLRGWALLALHDPDAALDAFWEAGARAAAAGHAAQRVEMLNGYAQCLVAGDPLAPARGLCAEATVRSRKLGQASLLALTLRTRGIVAWERCRFDEAEQSWDEALVHARAAREVREECATSERLAAFHRAVGQVAAGASQAERAMRIAADAGDRRAFAHAEWTYASCIAARGDGARAREARARAEATLDALRLPRPRIGAPEAWRRLFLEVRNHAAAGREHAAKNQAVAGVAAVRSTPPLLLDHANPSDVIEQRTAAAYTFCDVLGAHAIDVDALRADDEIALRPVDEASPAAQRARRVRVEAQHRLARVDRRALTMGFEIPAGARAAARAAVDDAWANERASR